MIIQYSTAAQIMTTKVQCLQPEDELLKLKHIYQQVPFHSHVPVEKNDVLVGIVSLIDFMRVIHDASLDDNEPVYHQLKVQDIMIPNPIFVSPQTAIKDVAIILEKGDIHSVLVVSANKVVGIITSSDIIRLFINSCFDPK